MPSLLFVLTLLASSLAFAQDAPAPAFVVPAPAQVALGELHALQLREHQLWEGRGKHCIGCGAAAIGVGTPFAATFVPWGALLLAFGEDDYGDRFDMRLGGGLLALGLVGVAGMVWGSYQVAKSRRHRLATDTELRSIADRRTLLEQLLESMLARPPS